MIKYICFILLLILISKVSYSQDDKILEIDKIYGIAKENIEFQNENRNFQNNYSISVYENLPAIGLMNIEYKIYFKIEPTNNQFEGAMYKEKFFFASKSTRILNVQINYQEFLFDENEKLIFYKSEYNFASEIEKKDLQVTCYYTNNELINIKISEFSKDNNTFNIIYEHKNTIPDFYENDYKMKEKTLITIKDLFETLKVYK
jgi:hypothetical protein